MTSFSLRKLQINSSKIGALFILIVLQFTLLSPLALAQSDIYKVLETPFYDPGNSIDTVASCSDTPSTGAGSLPTDIVALINQNKSVYEQAAQATNVPWQMLAGIHYRETGLSTNGSNLFQISGYSGPTDFQSQAIAAGNFIQKNAVPGNLPNHRAPLKQTGSDPDEIKDTLFSYNGRASQYAQQAQDLGFNPQTQPYEGSPYVMNNFDQIHMNMKIITHDNGPLDGVDTRFGAFTIYSNLGGASSSSSGSCSNGAVVGNEIQTAINYAWPDYHAPNYCKEKPSYQAAIQKASANGEYTGGTCTIGGTWIGVDCGAFVTRVMRDSQADPNYNSSNGNTIAQQQYLDAHPELYDKLNNVQGTKDLQPGDIAINDVHTYIYVGSQSGFNGNSASASFSDTGSSWRAPMADGTGIIGDFTWYRLKAGG